MRSPHTHDGSRVIVDVDEAKNIEDAKKLIGKPVIWKSIGKKETQGKVSQTHGSKGSVCVLFEKPLPGQCIGNKLEIA